MLPPVLHPPPPADFPRCRPNAILTRRTHSRWRPGTAAVRTTAGLPLPNRPILRRSLDRFEPSAPQSGTLQQLLGGRLRQSRFLPCRLHLLGNFVDLGVYRAQLEFQRQFETRAHDQTIQSVEYREDPDRNTVRTP